MPFSLTSSVLTRANFAVPLKSFLDGLESSLTTASTAASSALAAAQGAYTKPANGIPLADLASAVQTAVGGVKPSQTYRCVWNGTAYQLADGTVVTAGNRLTATYRDFVGPSNPNLAGLMVDGDSWVDTSA